MTITEEMQELSSEHDKRKAKLDDRRMHGDVRGYEEIEQQMIAVGRAHKALQIKLCSKPRESNI